MNATEYANKYETMRAVAVPMVDDPVFHLLVKACQTNPWLKVGGVDFEPEGFCCEHDHPYYLERYDDPEMLRQFFDHGNWGLRTAVMHRDLIFVNQVNGGDEWWTLKIDGATLVPFESITFRGIIARGEFHRFIDSMSKASVAQCRSLNYLQDGGTQ